MMKNNLPIKLFYYLIFFGFVFLSFFYGISSFPVEDMNEGLYAEIAREMLVLHNYVIPHLNFVPYLEKPPLLYWLVALNYHLFGISALAARLVPALAASIICIALLVFSNAMAKLRAGLIAALMLTSSLGFILVARVLIFDMLLTACFVIAMLCFYLWYQREKRYFLWFSYIALGLGFLTKGLVLLVLAAVIAFVFMLLTKTSWQKIGRLLDPVGIGLFFCCILPWVVMAILQQPGFAWDFFINEQVLRFLNKRIPHDYHTGPIYYYLPRILVYIFPWSLMLPILFKRNTAAGIKDKSLKIFLWLWFLIPLMFYSFSEAKGDYYMILGMPPLVMLLALKLDEFIYLQRTRWLLWIFYLLALCLIITSVVIVWANNAWLIMPDALIPALKWIAVFWVIYTIVSILIFYRWRNPLISLILIAGLLMPAVVFYVVDKKYEQSVRSQKNIAEFMSHQHPDWPVYLYEDYENFSSIVFYLKKRATIINSKSEDLYFGSHTPAANGWFIDIPTFLTQAKTRSLYVVLFKNKSSLFQNEVGEVKFCIAKETEKVKVLQSCL